MKHAALLPILGILPVYAGEPPAAPAAIQTAPVPWLVPTLDIRARYEFANIEGKDASHALTTRERVGLKTAEWYGFSTLVEGEFSQALVDDYQGGAPYATPFDPDNSIIADPQTNEINQAYLQYAGYDSRLRGGRQRIIYDNAAFIGNVGWRQNEQTFDAVSFNTKLIPGLTADYAYSWQVNRIFGNKADAPPKMSANVQDVRMNSHFINLSYAGVPETTLGGYIYLLNFEGISGWDCDTYGLSAKTTAVPGFTFYGETAFQSDAGPLNNENAWYAHGYITKPLGTQSLTLGVEFLGAGFQTPLATLHAFNGYADAFVASRTAGTHGGLTDIYLTHSIPLFTGLVWANTAHTFGDNAMDADLGWEIDSVLTKKFDEHFTSILKLAYFDTRDRRRNPGVFRVSVEVDCAF